MTGKGIQLPEWLPESMREDPKRTGVLAVLMLILIVVVLRFMLSSGPAPARAANTKQASQSQAGSGNIAALQAKRESAATRRWANAPLTPVNRNLFAIRTEFYPSTSAKAQNVSAVEGEGFWDAIEKSQSQQADQKKRREILVENLQREAAKLRLQSTVMGPEPQAIIGGSLVKEGDVVASDAKSVQFRVLKVEARRVIIEREGIRLELRMQQ